MPMEMTESGIVMEVKPLQYLNILGIDDQQLTCIKVE